MKITPTGVLVPNTAAPHTPDWYAARRQGITATDLPKILGLSAYGNALTVWNEKRAQRNDDSEHEAAMWGNILEGPVADRWADQNDTAIEPVGTLAHINNTWMMASLDRLVTGVCPTNDPLMIGGCGLEVKTRSAYVAGKWREDVPDDVLAQVQWQLMVSGLPHAHVACLLGGQRLVSYTVARDKQLEDYLMAAALPVWNAIQNGTPPDVTEDERGVLLAELNKMFAKREGAIEVDPERATELRKVYRVGHELESRGKRIKTVAKGNMVKLLKGAEVAVDAEGNPLWTYKRGEPADEMTAANLRNLLAKHPALYGELKQHGYITTTDPNPRFNLK